MTTANGRRKTAQNGAAPYDEAVTGLRNYWYPVEVSSAVTDKPRAIKIMDEPIALLRRNGKIYAIADECAHRGTPLSVGKYEFPGTNTITCRYHGWTYDVTNGACVAVLCEGPDSQVPGKIRIKTYPVEERKGIVWLWVGRMAPAPLEEDVPALLLREDTLVRAKRATWYGNWRFHAENVGGGHALVLHRDSAGMLFQQLPAFPKEPHARHVDDVDGHWLLQGSKGMSWAGDFPGLGRWPRPRPWRRTPLASAAGFKPLQGITQFGASLRLPGITRVVNFPFVGSMYYEWYVPVDEDHYVYFQVSCGWPKNPVDRAGWLFKYYTYGKPLMVGRFNMQDVRMVRHTTDYVKRRSMQYLSPLTMQDSFHIEWRRFANENARGEGTARRQEATAAAAGSAQT